MCFSPVKFANVKMFNNDISSLWFKLFLCPANSFLIGCYLPLGNTFFPPGRLLLWCSLAGLPVLPWTHPARNLQAFVLLFPLLGWSFITFVFRHFIWPLLLSQLLNLLGSPNDYFIPLSYFIVNALFTTWKYQCNCWLVFSCNMKNV